MTTLSPLSSATSFQYKTEPSRRNNAPMSNDTIVLSGKQANLKQPTFAGLSGIEKFALAGFAVAAASFTGAGLLPIVTDQVCEDNNIEFCDMDNKTMEDLGNVTDVGMALGAAAVIGSGVVAAVKAIRDPEGDI